MIRCCSLLMFFPISLIQLRFAESKQRYGETEGLSPVFVLSDLSVPSRTFEKIIFQRWKVNINSPDSSKIWSSLWQQKRWRNSRFTVISPPNKIATNNFTRRQPTRHKERKTPRLLQTYYLVASWVAKSRRLGGDFIGGEMTGYRTETPGGWIPSLKRRNS